VAQVLSAFGIFAVGYLMHPIVALESAISATSSATARTFSVVAIATNHPSACCLTIRPRAALAPIALALLRMIRGLSVGGEHTTSAVFMVEHAPPDRPGLTGAVACAGALCGILFGSATGAALPHEAYTSTTCIMPSSS